MDRSGHPRSGRQVGSEPVEVYALCLELKPDRLGPSGGKAGGGGGVGLLVALEVRVGAGLVGGTRSGEPFELTACRLIFSDRLGCGIKWDERAVRRFRLAT
jgi:hypothetical protein